MANSKATKKALFMSMMSLLLCFTMLMGATFAWFTDTVKSSGNIIKAGNLKIAMHWADGKEDPTSAVWKDASQEAIFDYKLWEPGYVDVKHIKIENIGSLALKYQLRIVPAGDVSILADVIDVYYLDPAEAIANRTELKDENRLGTLSEVIGKFNETAQGTLLANDNTSDKHKDTVTIALKMQESAGNDYQDKSIGDSFAVELYATQLAAEEDSFDNTYDKDAQYEKKDDGTIVVFSKEGLSAISKLASTDDSITSVNYNGEDVPVITSASDLSAAAKNKEEIVVLTSGAYTVPTTMATGQEIDIVGNKDTQINITNGHVNPSGGGATVNFTGVTLNVSGYTSGMGNGTKATYTDCTFNAAEMYLYGSSKFINCTFNDCGNYALWTWGAETAEFVGCTFNTSGKAIYANVNGVTHQNVIITNCKFYDTGDNDIQKAAIETGDDYGGMTIDLIITNTTVEGFAVTEDKTSVKNYGGNNLGTNVWGNKYQMGTDKLNVVIDGVDVY